MVRAIPRPAAGRRQDGAGSRPPSTGRDTVRLRGDRARACGSRTPRATLTPFSGAYLFTDPGDDALRLHLYETGRRYRVTVLARRLRRRGLRGARQPPTALGAAGQRRRSLGGRDRGGDRAPTTAVPPPSTFDEVVRRQRGRLRRVRRRRRPLARRRAPRPPTSPPTCCGRRRSRRAVSSPGQSVLMSKHWMDKVWSWDHCFNALALAPGRPSWPGDQFLAALRPPGRGRCPARLRHPLRGPVQLRQAADPRLGAAADLRRPLPATLDRRASSAQIYDRPGPLDPVLARRAPASRARVALLPARQRQRLGQRHDLRRRPRHRVADLAAFLVAPARRPRRPRRRARPPLDGMARKRRPGGPCPAGPAVDGRPVHRRSAPLSGRPEHRNQPARPDAPRARRPAARTTSARSWPIGIAGPPHHARPRHRAAVLPALRGRRLLARPDLGAVHSHRRGRPAPRGFASPRRRGQRPVPSAVRAAPASPRTSTPVPVRASATAPTPGPPRSTSSSPRLTSSERV